MKKTGNCKFFGPNKVSSHEKSVFRSGVRFFFFVCFKRCHFMYTGYTKKDISFGQSSKWKVVCLTKMHHISKNWEGVFDFQYKFAIGQCGQPY